MQKLSKEMAERLHQQPYLFKKLEISGDNDRPTHPLFPYLTSVRRQLPNFSTLCYVSSLLCACFCLSSLFQSALPKGATINY
jgi:hypothetical protein